MYKSYYLYKANEPAQLLGSVGWRWLPQQMKRCVLVIPRGLCLYEKLSVVGIPRWKYGEYVQTQVRAKSPFVASNYCYLRQGTVLHLWIWDESYEENFTLERKGEHAQLVIPSSLLAERKVDGGSVHTQHELNGFEMRLWKRDLLVDSVWLPSEPNANAVQDWLHGLQGDQAAYWRGISWPSLKPASTVSGTVQQWATASARKQPAKTQQWSALKLRRAALWGATICVASWLSFQWVSQETLKAQLQKLETARDQKIAGLETTQSLKSVAQVRLDWLSSISQLQNPTLKGRYLEATSQVVQKMGLLVRELEMNNKAVSATLVVPAGVNFRITSVVSALESEPLFYDARFVDVVGSDGFKFTWRLREQVESLNVGGKP